MYYFQHTLGCQMNEYDTGAYENTLIRFGLHRTEDIYQADLIFLNTCAVRDKTIRKAQSFLGLAAKIKKEKPELIVVLTGCASELVLHELKWKSYIDFVWGALNQAESPSSFEAFLVKKGFQKTNQNQIHPSGFSANIPIMFGCDSFCTYCIVPYLRGREKSIPLPGIIEQIDRVVTTNLREVVLLGQNVNHYGFDGKSITSFAQLLEDLAKRYPTLLFDFLTSHPRDFDLDILHVMQDYPNIYRHFHLPAQHGDNQILQCMNRGYTKEKYLGLVEEIRNRFPMSTLSTDLIVGFPGETEEAFQQTVDLVKKARFDMVFAAQYSKRPGTPAEKYPDQIPESFKKERINTLLDIQKEISRNNNQLWIGQTCNVLILSQTNPLLFSGKTMEEKFISIEGESLELGSIQRVKIYKMVNGSLFAKVTGEDVCPI